MFAALARFNLRSKITRESQARKKHFLPWEKIEKIALVLHKNDQVNKSAVDKFLDGTKKFVEVFYVELHAKTPSYSDWRCFSKKDASLLGLPQKTVATELKNKKYDLVINTCDESDLFAAAVVSSLHAPFKCGPGSLFSDVDMIIKKTEPYSLLNYLDEVLRYVKMIRV